MLLFVIYVIFIGAAAGSFACCQARRFGKKSKNKIEKWSVCFTCGQRLRWYENIPIVSWVIQKGKCRRCGASIGRAEILAEIGGIIGFLLGFRHFYVEYMSDGASLELGLRGVVWGVLLMILMIVGICDALTKKMPTKLLVLGDIVAGGYLGIELLCGRIEISNLLGSLIILPGLYYFLYKISNEKLVGGGDWMICLAIALVLHDWWLGIWVLYLANCAGAIVMLGMKKKQMAFGPYLILAFAVVFGFSEMFSSLILFKTG